MGTQAYLICDSKRTAYNLGKFLGTWTPVDWSKTDVRTFERRIIKAWTLAPSKKNSRERDYAWALANVLYRFCVDHAWAVRVVDEDCMLEDHGDFRLLGSRWPSDPPLGLGYDDIQEMP